MTKNRSKLANNNSSFNNNNYCYACNQQQWLKFNARTDLYNKAINWFYREHVSHMSTKTLEVFLTWAKTKFKNINCAQMLKGIMSAFASQSFKEDPIKTSRLYMEYISCFTKPQKELLSPVNSNALLTYERFSKFYLWKPIVLHSEITFKSLLVDYNHNVPVFVESVVHSILEEEDSEAVFFGALKMDALELENKRKDLHIVNYQEINLSKKIKSSSVSAHSFDGSQNSLALEDLKKQRAKIFDSIYSISDFWRGIPSEKLLGINI